MNNRIRTNIFICSALLILAGAILYLFMAEIASWLFAVGAAGITVCYLTLPYATLNFHQKRLHRMNIFAGILTIGASWFMFQHRTEWIVLLLISAFLQLYAAFRSGQVEKKG